MLVTRYFKLFSELLSCMQDNGLDIGLSVLYKLVISIGVDFIGDSRFAGLIFAVNFFTASLNCSDLGASLCRVSFGVVFWWRIYLIGLRTWKRFILLWVFLAFETLSGVFLDTFQDKWIHNVSNLIIEFDFKLPHHFV